MNSSRVRPSTLNSTCTSRAFILGVSTMYRSPSSRRDVLDTRSFVSSGFIRFCRLSPMSLTPHSRSASVPLIVSSGVISFLFRCICIRLSNKPRQRARCIVSAETCLAFLSVRRILTKRRYLFGFGILYLFWCAPLRLCAVRFSLYIPCHLGHIGSRIYYRGGICCLPILLRRILCQSVQKGCFSLKLPKYVFGMR